MNGRGPSDQRTQLPAPTGCSSAGWPRHAQWSALGDWAWGGGGEGARASRPAFAGIVPNQSDHKTSRYSHRPLKDRDTTARELVVLALSRRRRLSCGRSVLPCSRRRQLLLRRRCGRRCRADAGIRPVAEHLRRPAERTAQPSAAITPNFTSFFQTVMLP